MCDYVLASSKPWNFSQSNAEFNWKNVSCPEELNAVLAEGCRPRYIFFLHWNWLVPESVWSKYECVCFHMTDLPFGRGGSPLQNLILLGQENTSLTAFRMVRELDAGPIYCKYEVSLEGRAEDIYQRVAKKCAVIIDWMIQSEPGHYPQVGVPTVFVRRTPEESLLPTRGSLTHLFDFIRMLDAPTYPKAFIEYGSFRMEFSYPQLANGELAAKVKILTQEDQ